MITMIKQILEQLKNRSPNKATRTSSIENSSLENRNQLHLQSVGHCFIHGKKIGRPNL